MSLKSEIARRPLLAGLAGLVGLGAAGGIGFALLSGHGEEHRPGAYDDLVSKIHDHGGAEVVGEAVIGDLPDFNAAATAHALRKSIGKRPIADVTMADLADARLAEATGWVLPESVALICALAARD
jgi:hypothetical protein